MAERRLYGDAEQLGRTLRRNARNRAVVDHAGRLDVLVSPTVRGRVIGSGLAFEDAGEHQLKGVAERWHLDRAVGP